MMEEVNARGHENVLALHRSTLEFTRHEHLTVRGDCIIAVGSDKAMNEFGDDFKDALRKEGARVKVTIECDGLSDSVVAYGHPKLILDHPDDCVIRKSDYICGRTLAVGADKGAKDLSRDLVERLRLDKPVRITLIIQ
jgi:uncharacterized protein